MIRNPGNRIHPPLFESNVPAKGELKLLMTQVIDGLPPQNGYRDPWLDHCPSLMPSNIQEMFVCSHNNLHQTCCNKFTTCQNKRIRRELQHTRHQSVIEQNFFELFNKLQIEEANLASQNILRQPGPPNSVHMTKIISMLLKKVLSSE